MKNSLLALCLLAVVFSSPAFARQEHPPITDRTNPTAENPRRIILDIDPGIDDAMAVLLALQSPELQIEAITVVSGNVIVDVGAENALKLVELAGRPDVIVAKGAKYPLQRKLITAETIHGKNGLGDVELPAPTKELDARHAVDVILDIVNASPGQITLVPVGPLTNIGLALLKDPTLPSKVPEIILMGGSIVGGNASPAAEANIYNDPEAAKIRFQLWNSRYHGWPGGDVTGEARTPAPGCSRCERIPSGRVRRQDRRLLYRVLGAPGFRGLRPS